MHVPKDERVARWRAAAQQDRDLAQSIVKTFPHLACYHAQQAAEKALKAAITALQGDAVPTHLGRTLLAALSDLGALPPGEVRVAVLALDAYYIPTRYPDALDFADAAAMYGAEEARAAVAQADLVLRWVDER
ncbi:MAG: HEPN domain-containing protein [Vulcanimicrobiaceae bacterium]